MYVSENRKQIMRLRTLTDDSTIAVIFNVYQSATFFSPTATIFLVLYFMLTIISIISGHPTCSTQIDNQIDTTLHMPDHTQWHSKLGRVALLVRIVSCKISILLCNVNQHQRFAGYLPSINTIFFPCPIIQWCQHMCEQIMQPWRQCLLCVFQQ